ncbi:MAG: RNA polymerase sigma factor [Candidatus Electryonea clarkiae]|nr:RNA polymerase sigma factor [Candidatus Electryonea clarkiae]MDP8286477.1 RNA polymerase sigma factor [Candidatus Electryonea clarkiae]
MKFEEILRPVYPELVRYSRAMAGSANDGDDLLQDSLVKAWKSFTRLKKQEQFKYWLMSIIRNTHRSNKRRKWLGMWVSLDAIVNQPAEEELPFEDKELVRIALQGVPVTQREAIILFEILGMSVKEIAKIQKTSISAVKSRLSRGRLKLKERYETLNQEEVNHETDLARVV